MNVRPVSELMLYRYRYFFGYTLLGFIVAAVLLLNVNQLPPGLSNPEQASVIVSNALQLIMTPDNPLMGIWEFLRTSNTIDLPFHLLQKLSLHFFGLSPLGVRLPSLLLAAASAFALFQLLRRLFFANTALIMGVIAITSSWFLVIGRTGSPDIMPVFWTSLLLLLATLVSQETKLAHLWKALALLCVALSLYTPSMIYLYGSIFLASLTQPHLRYLLRSHLGSLAAGTLLLALFVVPLGFSIWHDPAIIAQLLAISNTIPDPLTFVQNGFDGLSRLASPMPEQRDFILTPLVSLPILALAIVGSVRLVRDWHSVRSHVLLTWIAVFIPVVGLGMSGSMAPLFIPFIVLATIGMQNLIRYWYKLFPKNPYARVFGLLPLACLILSILQFNYQRYFYALPFGPHTSQTFNQDPFVLHQALSSKAYVTQRVVLVVPEDKLSLYRIEQAANPQLQLVPAIDFSSTNNATRVVVAESEMSKLSDAQRSLLPQAQTSLLVNDRKENGLRFRVFQ
jgi:4-amino-4-deoxy-L-arabinose transferase-like glycosyltransferase